MDDEYFERRTPPIFLTFDTEEPENRTAIVDPGSSYLKTLPGLLKVLQMALSVFFLTCLIASRTIPLTFSIYFRTIAVGGFSFTGVLLASYLVGMDQTYPDLPWLKTEFIFCSILALSHLSAFVMATVQWKTSDEALIFGAFCSSGVMVVYGVNAWRKYREHMDRTMRSSVSSISLAYEPLIERY